MATHYLCKLTEGTHMRHENGVPIRYTAKGGEVIRLTAKEYASPLLKGRLTLVKKVTVEEEEVEAEAEPETEEEAEEEEVEPEVELEPEPEPEPKLRLRKGLRSRS